MYTLNTENCLHHLKFHKTFSTQYGVIPSSWFTGFPEEWICKAIIAIDPTAGGEEIVNCEIYCQTLGNLILQIF